MRSSVKQLAWLAGVALLSALLAGAAVYVHGQRASSATTTPSRHTVATTKHTPAAEATAVPATAPRATPTQSKVLTVPTATSDTSPLVLPVATSAPEATAIATAGDEPTAAAGGAAWISIDGDASQPGTRNMAVHGGGFASGEKVDLGLDGAASNTHATLTADAQGALDGAVPVQIPPGAGDLRLLATGQHSGLQASAAISVVPYVATLSLQPYAVLPGQAIDVSGQGYPPNVPVHLQVGSTPLQTVRADGGGNVQVRAAFTVPFDAVAGQLEVTATSDSGHTTATQNLSVLALKPWAVASTYALRAGDRVQFDAHGFAAGEQVKVYAGDNLVGQSNGPTDTQGNSGGIGPFAVPPGDPQPTFALVGARSGARAEVSLTVVSS